MSANVFPLFDPEEGGRARDEAIARVDAHAYEEWKRVAKRAARWVAEHQREFTSEDVRDAMERHYPDVTTHEPRAWVVPMQYCKGEHLAEPTGEIRAYRNPSRHRGTSRVWRSLVFKDEA